MFTHGEKGYIFHYDHVIKSIFKYSIVYNILFYKTWNKNEYF